MVLFSSQTNWQPCNSTHETRIMTYGTRKKGRMKTVVTIFLQFSVHLYKNVSDDQILFQKLETVVFFWKTSLAYIKLQMCERLFWDVETKTCIHVYDFSPTLGLPTLLLTLAPTPSACSTLSTDCLTCRGMDAIVKFADEENLKSGTGGSNSPAVAV